MIKATLIFVSPKKNPELCSYLETSAKAAKNLYNASLYSSRQIFTGFKKDHPTPNEQKVLDSYRNMCDDQNTKPRHVISYFHLEKLMRYTHNPDFFCDDLSAHTAQYMVKRAVADIIDWLKALREYRKDPSKFEGKPRMPRYKKGELCTFAFSNQVVTIRDGAVHFPKTKLVLPVSCFSEETKLCEVHVKPMYGGFLLCFMVETKEKEHIVRPHIAAIDLGVDNTAALVTNEGHSCLYKGGIIKSMNQCFNKNRAHYVSILQKKTKKRHVSSHRLDTLSRKRFFKMKDYFHKESRDIVNRCIQYNVGLLVVGENKHWKQNINIGHKNNQTFVGIPFDMLKKQLTYKCEEAGIEIVFVDESFTSKADFLSFDEIPTYDKDNPDKKYSFSGKRIQRGLYRSGTGNILNADINGACNILRKFQANAFEKVTDFGYLQKPEIISNLYM